MSSPIGSAAIGNRAVGYAAALLFALLMCGSLANAQIDREITVLALYSPPVAPELAKINTELSQLRQSWATTGIPVPLRFANGGAPLQTTLFGIPFGSAGGQVDWAITSSEVRALRDRHAADVVLIFTLKTNNTNQCGASRQIFNRANGFRPATSGRFAGLDLRGWESAHVSVIQVGGLCRNQARVAAHEFGHLLGMGHHQADSDPAPGLFADSSAHIRLRRQRVIEDDPRLRLEAPAVRQEEIFIALCTIGVTDACGRSMFGEIVVPQRLATYSDGTQDSANNNIRAMATTALSVANYIPPTVVPPPLPPIALFGDLVGHCDPPPYTHHEIAWSPNPNNVPGSIVRYEVWATPSPVLPYRFAFATSIPQTPAYVFGADFSVRIKACNRRECSVLSSASYLARWTCRDTVGGESQKLSPSGTPNLMPQSPTGGPNPTPVRPPFEEPICGGETQRVCR